MKQHNKSPLSFHIITPSFFGQQKTMSSKIHGFEHLTASKKKKNNLPNLLDRPKAPLQVQSSWKSHLLTFDEFRCRGWISNNFGERLNPRSGGVVFLGILLGMLCELHGNLQEIRGKMIGITPLLNNPILFCRIEDQEFPDETSYSWKDFQQIDLPAEPKSPMLIFFVGKLTQLAGWGGFSMAILFTKNNCISC